MRLHLDLRFKIDLLEIKMDNVILVCNRVEPSFKEKFIEYAELYKQGECSLIEFDGIMNLFFH